VTSSAASSLAILRQRREGRSGLPPLGRVSKNGIPLL
jgi:hypothetical protein